MSRSSFGIVLTGGTSTRAGRDKSAIEVGGETLARRAAAALAAATRRAVEVGPGRTGLPATIESPPGAGPLAAVVAGWEALVAATGEKHPCIVVACDLPAISVPLLEWLDAHPAAASVVPLLDGRAQSLCARWSVADLERARAQLAAGERSLRHVFGPDACCPAEEEWGAIAPRAALVDVDTPEDLADAAVAPPPVGDDWIGLGWAPLPSEAATRWATMPRCGAVVMFLGTARDHAEGRDGVEQLVYEAYDAPARARMRAVVATARERWPTLGRVGALHRLGALSVGDTAVCVVVSAPHREEAFQAGAFVIDTVKETVPIWKHERWRDGEGWGTGAHPVREVTASR